MSEFCWAIKGEADPHSGAPRLMPALGEPPYVNELRAQRDALAAALAAIIDDACSYMCSTIGRPGEPIQHSVQCKAARAALALLDEGK